MIPNQDKRVVVTQRTLRSELGMGEKLSQGDRPIVVYRSRREELIRAAEPSAPEPVEIG